MLSTAKTIRRVVVVISFFILIGAGAYSASIEPTYKNVAYGPRERDVLDFWRAESDGPTPLVIYIHGGGFLHGDKGEADDNDIRRCLAAGVSFASISYPYYQEVPLLEIIRYNIARSIQFLRYKSADFNIDGARIAVYGESAGAGSSLWLAFHDDLADPGSADPVLRESTRVAAAGALRPQATYDLVGWTKLFENVLDPKAMKAWRMIMGRTVLDMYHLKSEKELNSKETVAMRRELDMLSMVDKNDPPVYMISLESRYKDGDLLHHPRHAMAVKEKCDSAGIECILILDETPPEQRIDVIDFLLGHLNKK
jgi:hypothetical protein